MRLKITLTLFLSVIIHGTVISQVFFDAKTAKEPAKIAERVVIDQSQLECIYEYNDEKKEQPYYDILEIGRNISKYFSYGRYRTDSAVYSKDITRMTIGEYTDIANKYRTRPKFNATVLKNYENKQMEVYDKVFIDHYVYKDSVNIDWKLSNDTATVCGYLCKKAETDFRGRHWSVYYAEDIAVSDGPWKLSGLPGLILKAEDATGEHSFSAIIIRKSSGNIYITKSNNSFKTKRERFNKQLKEYMANPSGAMAGSAAAPTDNKTGKPAKMAAREYNPLELE